MSKQSITVASKDFDGAARIASKLENAQSLKNRRKLTLALAAIYRGKSYALQKKNDDKKRGQLKFFARPPRSKRSISDKQLVPCDDY